MPDFFDFSNPNSPMDNGSQSWGGDMIYGGNQPIAPPANPFEMNMPQMPQGGMNTPVPFDALAAMNGIQMPQIPQQDSMGRYGINDTQRADAGRQSLAAILMGAGRSMFDDNPNAVLQSAAASGDIRRGALDKASQENVNAFKLQVEAKAKELDFLSKKSDIAKQQMQIEAEQMKLEELKLKRQVAVQFGKEMAPVAADALAKAAQLYPDKVDSVKQMFLAAQAKLAEGDVDGATARFDLAMAELPSEWAKDAHEKMLKATVEASNKFGIGLEMAKNPELVNAVRAAGGRIDIGDNGEPKVVTKQEIEMENLRKQQLQASIASENAQAAAYANRQPGGAFTQGALTNEIQQLDQAAQQLAVPVPSGLTDPTKEYELKAGRAQLEGVLGVTGMDAKTWLALTPQQKEQKLMQIRGGVKAPPVAPPQAGANPGQSGAPIPAVAIQQFKSMSNATPEQKLAALKSLASSDPALSGKIKEAWQKIGQPKDKADADRKIAMLYIYIAGQLPLR